MTLQKSGIKRNIILDIMKTTCKHNFESCKSCEGTGLKGYTRHLEGGASWDGSSTCDTCDGVGFVKWRDNILFNVCTCCNGSGNPEYTSHRFCSKCGGKGYLDWVEQIRGEAS